MKLTSYPKKTLIILLLSSLMTLFLVSCSDEDDNDKKEAPKISHNPFDHSHDSSITDMVKHKFEHQFADECVARETHNSVNQENDKARFEKPCMCIAQFLMKDLTAKEAELFLTEHRNTQSLRIRFDNAAFHCLQQKAQPQGPQLFGRH